MMDHVDTLKQWLKTAQCVQVPDDWVEACVEWIQEENQGSTLRLEDLKSQVYEQWLMSDLRELKTAVLPSDLTVNRKIEINGVFAVQIDSAVDVGCSFYSQIQKVKGTENPNALVSGEEPKQPSWEPKPTRMIILDLSDGVMDVKAMEYKPITALSPFITPGTKMLIKGPVLCRHGMLMLGPDNVHILGGEVDSLIETNTAESVLTKAMQESQANSGKSERQEFSGRMLTKGEEKKTFNGSRHRSQVSPTQWPHQAPAVRQEPIKREKINLSSQHPSRGNSQQIGRQDHRLQVKQETEPDWEDDFDYDALMADMEHDAPQQLQRGVNSDRRIKTEPLSQQEAPPIPGSANQQAAMKISDEDFMDDFDDDFDIPVSILKSAERHLKDELQSRLPQRSACTAKNKINTAAAVLPRQPGILNPAHTSRMAGDIKQEKKTKNISNNAKQGIRNVFGSPNIASSNVFMKKTHLSEARAVSSETVSMDDFDDDFEMEDLTIRAVNTPERPTAETKRFKTDSGQDRVGQFVQTDNCSSIPSQAEPDITYTSSRSDVPKAVIHPFPNGSNNQVSNTRVKSSRSTQKERGQSRMERFFGGCVTNNTVASPSQAVIPSGESFTYLSTVLSSLPVAEPKEVIIKGYISTLTSKLTSCQGKEWNLSCRINDGTGAVNVNLANSVLTKLIGFSAEDSVVMKQRAKADPTVKDVLTEGLQLCQQSLTDLSSLMKIKFLPGQSKPVLIQIIPVNSSHVFTLYDRIKKKYFSDR